MKLRTQTPLEDEALVEKGVAWARSLVEESAPYRVNDSFNVFATAAIAKCCESGGGRPDLIQLCKIPELIAWILSFPQSSKWLHVRKVLQEVHQQHSGASGHHTRLQTTGCRSSLSRTGSL